MQFKSHASSSPVASTQLVVQCPKCTLRLGIPPYVDLDPLIPRPSPKPIYCPRCSHQRVYRTLDYADTLSQCFFGLTRKGAISCITEFNERSLQGTLPTKPGHGRPLDPHDLLHIHWGFPRLLARSSISPLTISCTSCSGQYTLLRVHPDLQQTPPLYCVWCGQKSVHITQDNTEETAWISLASHHSLSVSQVQFFYNDWSSLPNHTHVTFASYLASPEVAPLVQAAQASTSKVKPATPVAQSPAPQCQPSDIWSAEELAAKHPAQSATLTIPPEQPFYSVCAICGCEQPNEVRPGKRTISSLAAYCEPCTLNIQHQRQSALRQISY